MSQIKLDAKYLILLRQALAMLPGIKPNIAAEWITETYLEAVMMSHGLPVSFGPLKLDDSMFAELSVTNATGTYHVTPKGAQFLMELYTLNGFPDYSRKAKKQGESLEELKRYSLAQDELTQKMLEDRKQREAKASAREKLIAHPDLVQESEFELNLLDAIFIQHKGLSLGIQGMVIGGITITKQVSRYRSNSGKNHDYKVVFEWTGYDGQPQALQTNSFYSGNRRNDADRNWGLPE